MVCVAEVVALIALRSTMPRPCRIKGAYIGGFLTWAVKFNIQACINVDSADYLHSVGL